MRRTVAAVSAGVAIVLAAVGVAAASTFGTPDGTFDGCPAGLRLPPSSSDEYTPAARRVALRFLGTTYAQMNRSQHWGLRLAGAKAVGVLPVRRWLPSGWIKRECGLQVWQRSFAVFIRLPAMEYPNPKGPCNDCAHVTLLLGKTSRGWVVWGRY